MHLIFAQNFLNYYYCFILKQILNQNAEYVHIFYQFLTCMILGKHVTVILLLNIAMSLRILTHIFLALKMFSANNDFPTTLAT